MLDPVAVGIFAKNGIELVECPPRDFAWSHDTYLKTEPIAKDIEIRIHEKDYMGAIVHRETHKHVHIDDAAALAGSVLATYQASTRH